VGFTGIKITYLPQRSIVNRKKILAAGAVTGLLTFGLVVPQASAIQRDVCNASNVTVYSANSTCWAWAGTASVALYGTVAASGGINNGRVYRSGIGNAYFYAGATTHYATATVTVVQIY